MVKDRLYADAPTSSRRQTCQVILAVACCGAGVSVCVCSCLDMSVRGLDILVLATRCARSSASCGCDRGCCGVVGGSRCTGCPLRVAAALVPGGGANSAVHSRRRVPALCGDTTAGCQRRCRGRLPGSTSRCVEGLCVRCALAGPRQGMAGRGCEGALGSGIGSAIEGVARRCKGSFAADVACIPRCIGAHCAR